MLEFLCLKSYSVVFILNRLLLTSLLFYQYYLGKIIGKLNYR